MNFNYKIITIITVVVLFAIWVVVKIITPHVAPKTIEPTREIIREIVYDTIYYHSIEPIKVIYEEELPPTDSVYIYRDTISSRWSAEITGNNVNLRNITLFDQRETIYTTTYRQPTWEVAIKSEITPYTQWVGVGVTRTIGRAQFSLNGGYDPWKRRPHIGITASFAIWRE